MSDDNKWNTIAGRAASIKPDRKYCNEGGDLHSYDEYGLCFECNKVKPMTKQDELASAIVHQINEHGSLTWKEIQDLATTKCNYNPLDYSDGWMFLRGAVQIAINDGDIKRDGNIHTENYIPA